MAKDMVATYLMVKATAQAVQELRVEMEKRTDDLGQQMAKLQRGGLGSVSSGAPIGWPAAGPASSLQGASNVPVGVQEALQAALALEMQGSFGGIVHAALGRALMSEELQTALKRTSRDSGPTNSWPAPVGGAFTGPSPAVPTPPLGVAPPTQPARTSDRPSNALARLKSAVRGSQSRNSFLKAIKESEAGTRGPPKRKVTYLNITKMSDRMGASGRTKTAKQFV